ncbi:hypothetical protein BX600DRAFT_408634 [Xylariales sp. PMI_506]|nr:hypothetical protein BX600DRAFT_408634 [Xylariales sp. PMI_506]
MSSTSPTTSTLTRPRVAVAIISAIATAASVGYYLYHNHISQTDEGDISGSRLGLHRSNAVRRARHQTLRRDDSSESETHGDENSDANQLVPLLEVVASDGPNDDEWGNDTNLDTRQRTGENIVTLLFRVSEDNARRNAYVHRGCQCNGCGMVPIRGIRYRCANCADFDLCEVCESQGLHNKTHVFYKVRIPAPPFCPRQVQPAWYPGDPDNSIRALPRYLLFKWSQETGFERVELDAYWEQWTFLANTEWRDDPDGLYLAMDRKTFERCLVPSGGYRHTTPNLIYDRMFAFYDTNKDDLIGFEEFLHGVSYRKRKDKLKRTFEGYDIDGDGYVNRKDFLRVFRAYYVLYKQMHRDILDGLDDHMMTTTEAQQLVSSSAPLSSLFGREGRVPPADHSRLMEGKVFHSNGDVNIHDGKVGVVSEDKPDISSREDILTGLFARNSNRSFFTESFGPSSRHPRSPSGESRYISGIINPPHNMVDLTSVINGDASQLDDIIASIRNDTAINHPLPEENDDSESTSSDEDGEETPDDTEIASTLGLYVNGDGGSRHIAATEADRFTTRLSGEGELRAPSQTMAANNQRLGVDKRKRVHARKQLHERWKRRHFYLDEEEGAIPPQGWDDSDDILVNLHGIGGSSKPSGHTLSPRSRSSSKVRFVEDGDDFDIRSNPSTSSRSIPERWGGVEIPDAERDAGKEILYQVTQQAFNELLDEIFKKKEDLAIRCAETRSDRKKYRHRFEHLQPQDSSPSSQDRRRTTANNRPIQDQSLGELLSASGYTVSPRSEEEQSTTSERVLSNEQANGAVTLLRDEADTPTISEGEHISVLDTKTPTNPVHRDPTMPQFRPNGIDGQLETTMDVKQTEKQEIEASTNGVYSQSAEDDDENIAESTLEEWRILDLAEEEAKERGGWGKLSFVEFEKIYKDHEFQDSSRNPLDYLGSWIDFCIPP